jgi:hypothetical protein
MLLCLVRGRWRVLAAHDRVRWDMGFFFGGGHERPDARLGAMWRTKPVEGVLL